jgi:hypothetical protein
MAEDTANMAKNIMVLDKTEAALEKEVEKEEKRPPPSTTVGKYVNDINTKQALFYAYQYTHVQLRSQNKKWIGQTSYRKSYAGSQQQQYK